MLPTAGESGSAGRMALAPKSVCVWMISNRNVGQMPGVRTPPSSPTSKLAEWNAYLARRRQALGHNLVETGFGSPLAEDFPCATLPRSEADNITWGMTNRAGQCPSLGGKHHAMIVCHLLPIVRMALAKIRTYRVFVWLRMEERAGRPDVLRDECVAVLGELQERIVPFPFVGRVLGRTLDAACSCSTPSPMYTTKAGRCGVVRSTSRG